MVEPCYCPKVGGGGDPVARGQAVAVLLHRDVQVQLLPRTEAESRAGGMTAPEITFGPNRLPGCLLQETPTCLLGTESAVCVTVRILQGDFINFHVSPHPRGFFPLNIFYLE